MWSVSRLNRVCDGVVHVSRLRVARVSLIQFLWPFSRPHPCFTRPNGTKPEIIALFIVNFVDLTWKNYSVTFNAVLLTKVNHRSSQESRDEGVDFLPFGS